MENIWPQELEEEKKAAEAAKKQAKLGFLGNFFRPGEKEEDEGSLEFSLAGLFKIMCCVHKKPQEEMHQLMRIAESLNSLNRRLDSMERILDPSGAGMRRRSVSSRVSVRTTRDSGGGAAVNNDVMLAAVDEADEDDLYDSEAMEEESVANGKLREIFHPTSAHNLFGMFTEPKIERDDMINP